MFLHIFSAIEDNHNWVHHPSCWKTRPFSWKKLSMTTSLRVWKLVASLRNTLKRLAGALIKHYLVTIQFIAEKNSAKNHTWKHTKNQTCSWCNGRSFRFPYQPYQDPDICQKLSSISAQRPRSLLGGSVDHQFHHLRVLTKKFQRKTSQHLKPLLHSNLGTSPAAYCACVIVYHCVKDHIDTRIIGIDTVRI